MTRTALAGLLSILALPATAGPDALGCFTRTYDRAHLARHPDQVVTAVKLRIYRPPPGNANKYWFAAQFRVRGKDKPLRTSGICNEKAQRERHFLQAQEHFKSNLDSVQQARQAAEQLRPREPKRHTGDGGLYCFVECDGGGVDVVPRARDAMMYSIASEWPHAMRT